VRSDLTGIGVLQELGSHIVIYLQHRQPCTQSAEQAQLISMIGLLVGAEIERARLEGENSMLSEQPQKREALDRAKREVAEASILSDEIRRGRGDS